MRRAQPIFIWQISNTTQDNLSPKLHGKQRQPVEDGQRHGDVGDDRPGPVPAIELNLHKKNQGTYIRW